MTRKHKITRETPCPASPAEARLRRRLADAKEALARIARGESPSPEELATAPRLEFWCIVAEEPFLLLQGVVSGHPLLGEGHMVATSPLLWISKERTAARTVSRWYRLGVPLSEAPRLSH